VHDGGAGVKVTLIEARHEVIGFLDEEITEAFQYHMRRAGMTLRLGKKWRTSRKCRGKMAGLLRCRRRWKAGRIFGRRCCSMRLAAGTTASLKLEKVGLKADDRERLKVNEHYQTDVPHIYAAGDVIGFPALASTAMEQGRLAICHAFGVPTKKYSGTFSVWDLFNSGNFDGGENRGAAYRGGDSV